MAYISQYPPAHSSTYVLATTEDGAGFSPPYFATDPALSLTGAGLYNSWVSSYFEYTNQKFNIALATSKVIRRIYLENYHNSGGLTNRGVNNFTVYGTNESTAFNNTTYATTTDLTLLGTFQADAHSAADESDPQYFDLSSNTTLYQYYVFRFADSQGSTNSMNIRHLELQSDDSYEVHDPSGGGIAGGEALVHPDKIQYDGLGGTIGGGAAPLGCEYIVAGGAVGGGSADIAVSLEGTGGAVAGGSALWNSARTFVATGGGIAGGDADFILVFSAAITGSIGFSGEIRAVQWTDNLKGSIGFSGSISIDRENSLATTGAIGLTGTMDVVSPMSVSLAGSFGISGAMIASQDERLSMTGSLGFDGSVNIVTQNLFNIIGGLGIGSSINILIDGSSDYSLVDHNSTRWT